MFAMFAVCSYYFLFEYRSVKTPKAGSRGTRLGRKKKWHLRKSTSIPEVDFRS